MTCRSRPEHLARTAGTAVVGGGSSVAGWELIEDWGSINDPGSVTTGATGDVGGTVTIVIADGTTTQVDGVRENRAHFRKLITSHWVDFDYTKDIFDLKIEVSAYSHTATLHKIGFAFGITEGVLGSRLGSMVGFYPNTATAINSCHLTTTGFNGNGSLGNFTIDRMRYLPYLTRTDTTDVDIQSRSSLVTTAGEEPDGRVPATPSNPLTVAGVANWSFELGHIKASTTDPGADITLICQMYARRCRTSGILSLT